MMEVIVPPKRRFLQEPYGVTFQNAAFFIVTVAKTSNLTIHYCGIWDGPQRLTICISKGVKYSIEEEPGSYFHIPWSGRVFENGIIGPKPTLFKYVSYDNFRKTVL
jgi:hypothetical protein